MGEGDVQVRGDVGVWVDMRRYRLVTVRREGEWAPDFQKIRDVEFSFSQRSLLF